MLSPAAPRCQHIKVSGIQCGSPALRTKNFCFYHQQNRRITVDCYYNPEEYPTGEINLPPFEDAHSIQTVIRQVVQMLMQKRIERKTASLLLHALQIASSNLKRMEQEKPQPAEVVTDPDSLSQAPTNPTNQDENANVCHQLSLEAKRSEEDLPPATITIQACYRPERQLRSRPRQSHQQKKAICNLKMGARATSPTRLGARIAS